MTLTGDPGDSISGGQNYSFSAGAGDHFSWYLYEGAINAYVDGVMGDSFGVTLAGPGGKRLRPRTYEGAVGYYSSVDPAGPAMDVSGNARRCSSLTGSFTVHEIKIGNDKNFTNAVLYLHATFEQHCDGAGPALRGEVELGKPRPGTTQGAETEAQGEV
ncbi:MAG: hypothetical protein WD627_10110 [Actinomycetota bacterium]